MAKVYTEEELNNFSRETLMAVILSMQDQIHQLNTNMERLIEQIADANNKRYGRSSEKLETISGQLELELIFNEAEALTETLYVVEPVEEDVIQPRRKNKGKREADLKDLPIEVIVHTLSEEKLQDVFGTDGWKQLPDEIYKRVRVQPAVYGIFSSVYNLFGITCSTMSHPFPIRSYRALFCSLIVPSGNSCTDISNSVDTFIIFICVRLLSGI